MFLNYFILIKYKDIKMNAFAFKSHTKSVPSTFNMYSQMNIQRANNKVKYYVVSPAPAPVQAPAPVKVNNQSNGFKVVKMNNKNNNNVANIELVNNNKPVKNSGFKILKL